MKMTLETEPLILQIKRVSSDILGKDVTTFKGFSERQLKAIAEQTILVEMGIATGEITEATQDFFLKSIKDLVKNFTETLKGLMLVTINKLYNAILDLIWNSIKTATNVVLPSFSVI
ncbi:MAG: hypothetical protein U9R28_11860 [Pseudomonadota bacterium]|nr:hypothetical protein [Pseudomonadota bacterium]